MKHFEPKISIIILNWNGLTDTIECLESLKKITYQNYKITVVDNGSESNDATVLSQKYKDYVELICSEKNRGFAGGNNIALECLLRNSDSDYFLLLNNDTSVDPEFLSEMVKVTESNPDVGIAGCKTYFYDEPNRLQVVWQELNLCTGQNVLVGSMEMDGGQYERVKIVEYVQGSCFLIKRKVVEKIGLLDEAFFCYWEEADYCLQAAKAGYKTVYVPKAKIWHKESLSISRSSEVASYYLARNIFLIMRKHATKRQFLSFLFYFFGYQFWYTSLESIIYHRNIGEFAAFFKGTVDGIKLIYR